MLEVIMRGVDTMKVGKITIAVVPTPKKFDHALQA